MDYQTGSLGFTFRMAPVDSGGGGMPPHEPPPPTGGDGDDEGRAPRRRFLRLRAMFATRTRKAAAVVGALAVGMTGAALAQWLLNASVPHPSANGQFSTPGALTGITVSAGVSSAADCSPGDKCGGVITISNANAFPVKLNSISGTGESAINPGVTVTVTGAQNNATCQSQMTTSGTQLFSGGAQTFSPAITIPANAVNQSVTIPNYFTIGPLPDNSCAGGSFTESGTSTTAIILNFST